MFRWIKENEINEILLADNRRLYLYCPPVKEMKWKRNTKNFFT